MISNLTHARQTVNLANQKESEQPADGASMNATTLVQLDAYLTGVNVIEAFKRFSKPI